MNSAKDKQTRAKKKQVPQVIQYRGYKWAKNSFR